MPLFAAALVAARRRRTGQIPVRISDPPLWVMLGEDITAGARTLIQVVIERARRVRDRR